MIDLISYRKKFVDWAVIFGADRGRAQDAAMGIDEERAEEMSPENLARHFVKTDYIYEGDIPKFNEDNVESDKGLSEAMKLLDNAGYVCERYSGDNYVSDHLIGVEVPGLVHSYVSGIDHYFDTEEEDDYEAQLVIYSGSFRVWCKIEPMKDPLIERGDLPDFFWKKSSYQDGELSRVSRWIKRKIESLRQKCLLRVKELSDLT